MLRPNRDTLFVMIRSISPARQSSMSRRNSTRFFTWVPEMPEKGRVESLAVVNLYGYRKDGGALAVSESEAEIGSKPRLAERRSLAVSDKWG